MKAVLKNYRQSPRKVRLLADLVRGKSVTEALEILKKFVPTDKYPKYSDWMDRAILNCKNMIRDFNK